MPPKHPLLFGCGGMIGVLVALVILLRISVEFGFFGIIVFLAGVPALFWLLRWAIKQGALIDEDEILDIPYVGWLYDLMFSPVTYYRLDTAHMFQETVRAAVNEVIAGLKESGGLRTLSPEELRPRTRDIAK